MLLSSPSAQSSGCSGSAVTLIVALPVSEGVILASDGQITMGAVRTSGPKLYRLNDATAWGASGELALIQRVDERLWDFTLGLYAGRSRLAEAIKESIAELLREDFRTPFSQGSPDVLLRLHPGDFVFAECPRDGEVSRVLHIANTGTAEWVSGHAFASGNGDLFAHALLRKYDMRELGMDEAKLLAVKTIEEVIQVGAYGLGPPIQAFELTRSHLREIPETEIQYLSDEAEIIREQERVLLSTALSL